MIVLVLGGARSGKSALAERIAAKLAAETDAGVTYVAVSPWPPGMDDEDVAWAARVAAHRARRPVEWLTEEVHAPEALDGVLASIEGVAVIDSTGSWVAFHGERDVAVGALADAVGALGGDVVVVGDEVGQGVHPETELGRRYRDVLGEVNQAVRAVADHVLLAVAGGAVRVDDPAAAVAGLRRGG